MQLWDVASGKLKIGFDGARGPFAFAPDGKTLATGACPLRLWDVATGKMQREWRYERSQELHFIQRFHGRRGSRTGQRLQRRR